MRDKINDSQQVDSQPGEYTGIPFRTLLMPLTNRTTDIQAAIHACTPYLSSPYSTNRQVRRQPGKYIGMLKLSSCISQADEQVNMHAPYSGFLPTSQADRYIDRAPASSSSISLPDRHTDTQVQMHSFHPSSPSFSPPPSPPLETEKQRRNISEGDVPAGGRYHFKC